VVSYLVIIVAFIGIREINEKTYETQIPLNNVQVAETLSLFQL